MALLRAIAFVLFLGAVLVFVVPVQWVARRRRWRLQDHIQRLFSRTMCSMIGVSVEAHGRLPGDGPRFIVANHVSWVDILALSSLYPLVFLAKREVADWPVLGFLARLQGTIFIERANRRKIPQVNARLAETLRQGYDIVVFPEGTSSDGSTVLKFNAGHFGALCDDENMSTLTLAPVGIAYADASQRRIDVGWYGDMTFVPHLWSLLKRNGTVCHLFFGDALALRDADRKTLAHAAESSVRLLLHAPNEHAPSETAVAEDHAARLRSSAFPPK
jgi:1-acyl-sn-glycerol-3-phosphate acyltransferase